MFISFCSLVVILVHVRSAHTDLYICRSIFLAARSIPRFHEMKLVSDLTNEFWIVTTIARLVFGRNNYCQRTVQNSIGGKSICLRGLFLYCLRRWCLP